MYLAARTIRLEPGAWNHARNTSKGWPRGGLAKRNAGKYVSSFRVNGMRRRNGRLAQTASQAQRERYRVLLDRARQA